MDKFTNIAGGAFQKYVSDELENRKKLVKKYNSNDRSNEELIYQNRNSFYRITSCTDINPEHTLSKLYGKVGNQLAKDYILQGGVVKNNQNNIIQREGISGIYKTTNDLLLGFKPMPGVTSINLSSAGKLGTLQYADINIKCYDLEQLDIIDALYMKLGFTVIIEWGHNIFYNNGIVKTSPLDTFSYNNKEELITAIQKHRVNTNANYDAMVGTISNFSWELDSDNTYNCNIKVVGAGDILDSLKINQSVTDGTSISNEEYVTTIREDDDSKENITSLIADKDLSLLNQALYLINTHILSVSDDSKPKVIDLSSKTYIDILNKIYKQCPYKFIQFDESGNIVSEDENALKGNHYSVISKLNKTNGSDETIIPNINRTLFSCISVPYTINGGGDEKAEPQTYISLGHLLALITATGMIYDKNQNDIKPYIYIDFNDSLNFCSTFKGQTSLNPNICLIPRNQGSLEDTFGLGFIEDKLFNELSGFEIKEVKSNQRTEYQNQYGRTMVETKVITTQEISNENKIINGYLNIPANDSKVRARMMCILINIKYITDTLKSQRGENNKGNVNISDFLNSILDGINKSMCNFNDFRIIVDDSCKSMRIIDDTRTQTDEELQDDSQYTEIPLFGNRSIVYNYNFKSKISPEMSGMVTIAAQANPQALGDDAFAISNLSRDLTNRISSEKFTSNTKVDINREDNVKQNNESLESLVKYLKSISGDGGDYVINNDEIDSSTNTYKTILSKYRNQHNPTNRGTTIIPLTFELEMDGISGIIPNSAFVVPVNMLPSSYATRKNLRKICFIIHSIKQNIGEGRWTTTISGQTLNIRFDESEISEMPKLISSTTGFNNFNNIGSMATLFNNQVCSRSALEFLEDIRNQPNIKLITEAMKSVGLTSKYAIASAIAIASGESGLRVVEEGHIYSYDRLNQLFKGLSDSQISKATVKGISKKEFFTIIYGEYRPKRVGNRNKQDGGLYYGRGFIQLTGWGNYKKYTELSGTNILNNPNLMLSAPISAKILAHYLKDRVNVNHNNPYYIKHALKAVGRNVPDILNKKMNFYNCYLNKL